MDGDLAAVKETGESDVDAANGEDGTARELESATGEESGEGVAVGEDAELGEGEAARDDVEAEGVGVRRRRLSHVESEERSIGGCEEREGGVVSVVGFTLLLRLVREKIELKIGGDDSVAEEVVASHS